MGVLVSFRALTFGVALFALPLAVAADARANFRAGILHADKAAWGEAAAAFRAAQREDPKETGEPVRIYGMRYEDYRPHFQLARALIQLGNHSGAREVLDQLVRQGPQSRLATSRIRFLYQQCNTALGVRLETTATGTKAPPAVPPALVGIPDPPVARCSGTPSEVHRCSLQTVVEEGERWLGKATTRLAEIDRRQSADPDRFQREPARGALAAARDLLAAARFRLAACRLEGDLEGARTARDDARVAAEELERLARGH
jgi:tetratricopeptide (TPR) repeat protein